MIVNYPRMRRRAASGPKAAVTPTAGVTYINGLSGLEASEISSFAQAISDCAAVTNETETVYVDFGNIHRKISVGHQATLSLNGTNYAFNVLGFNHDELTNPTAYGIATATGRAGITFGLEGTFETKYMMNVDEQGFGTNVGGWENSAMRMVMMPRIKRYLPTLWQTVIKPVNKISGVGGGASTGTEVTTDDCFLLSEVESFGVCKYSIAGEGTQYALFYFAASNIINSWERSPVSGDATLFCRAIDGSPKGDTAEEYNTFSFAFCI